MKRNSWYRWPKCVIKWIYFTPWEKDHRMVVLHIKTSVSYNAVLYKQQFLVQCDHILSTNKKVPLTSISKYMCKNLFVVHIWRKSNDLCSLDPFKDVSCTHMHYKRRYFFPCYERSERSADYMFHLFVSIPFPHLPKNRSNRSTN